MAINMDLMGPREGEEEIFERECLIFDAEIEANRRLKRQQVKTGDRSGRTEADGDFGIVPEAQIASWQKKLNERFGIGSGKLVSTRQGRADD